jgi:galactokinase
LALSAVNCIEHGDWDGLQLFCRTLQTSDADLLAHYQASTLSADSFVSAQTERTV